MLQLATAAAAGAALAGGLALLVDAQPLLKQLPVLLALRLQRVDGKGLAAQRVSRHKREQCRQLLLAALHKRTQARAAC